MFQLNNYKCKFILAPSDLNYPNLFLEVDDYKDLVVIRKIYSYFDSQKIDYFSLKDIIKFINKNPSIAEINSKVFRKWKLLRDE